MSEPFKLVADSQLESIRLDKFLTIELGKIRPEITRSKVSNLLELGAISDINSKIITSGSRKVKLGEQFFVNFPKQRSQTLQPKDIPIEIIFEDEHLMVVNKPDGLTVHPGSGNQDETLVNALLFTHQNQLSSINGDFRPGIVHRLDKDTSGIMIVAKNDLAHQLLSEKLKNREINRYYLCFVYGSMLPLGRIHKNIVRSRINRLKMRVSRIAGREAITNYKTKETFLNGVISLLECKLETGRTHQIRVHFESEKHSLVGDQLYNSCKKTIPSSIDSDLMRYINSFPRQALHSYKLSFLHPITEKEMEFECPLPEDMQRLYDKLASYNK